jgi:Cytochrome c/c1 heme lyase
MGTGASKETTSTAEGLKNAPLSRASSSSNDENALPRAPSAPEVVVEPTTTSSKSQCPMANADGSHSWDLLRALGSKSFPHWMGGSKPMTKEEALAATLKPTTTDPEGGCPVKKTQQAAPFLSGGCPVKDTSSSDKPEYNVYAQALDPSNQMPSNPNQLPAPQQAKELSTNRVSSTIPKVGRHDRLLFP